MEQERSNDESVTTRPWAATLLALLPALALILLIETARVVATVSGSSLDGVLGTLSEVTLSGLRQLALLALIVLAQAGALLLIEPKVPSPLRYAARALLIGLVGLQVYLIWLEAIEAPHLARLYPARLAFQIAAAVLALVLLWHSLPQLLTRTRRALGAVIAIGSLTVSAAHYQVLIGLYPTLHSSAAMFSFLGVASGLAMALAGARPSRKLVIAALGAPAIFLVGAALVPGPAQSRGRPYVASQSALVRPVMIAETPEHLLRPSSPPQRRDEGSIRPDPQAEDRFAEHCGLPALPEAFDLADHDVLLIFIDALRYDRTSLADPELGTTPTLASLVEDGAYTSAGAVSPSNGTFPSMSSLLSMTTPSFVKLEIHARHWHGRVSPDQVMAPEVFREAGYQTFWVGHNFKRVMSIRVHDLWQGFERRHMELIWPGQDLDADARIASKAIQEIRAARAAGKRYFGIVFFISPHDDYQVHFPRRPSDTPRDRYDQEILYADRQMKRVLDEVARGGGLEETVVVVTGDHGEAFREHGHRYHLSSLYAEQVRVPLVIRVPEARGRRLTEPTSNLFVLPWLMLRGPEPLRQAALTSLRADLGPLMRETEGAVISEFISRQRQEATLRYGDHTIYYDLLADFFRVFDARRDPGEQHDLREERPDLVERYTPLVQAYRKARFAGQRYFFNEEVTE